MAPHPSRAHLLAIEFLGALQRSRFEDSGGAAQSTSRRLLPSANRSSAAPHDDFEPDRRLLRHHSATAHHVLGHLRHPIGHRGVLTNERPSAGSE
jgi:hypothetical protein